MGIQVQPNCCGHNEVFVSSGSAIIRQIVFSGTGFGVGHNPPANLARYWTEPFLGNDYALSGQDRFVYFPSSPSGRFIMRRSLDSVASDATAIFDTATIFGSPSAIATLCVSRVANLIGFVVGSPVSPGTSLLCTIALNGSGLATVKTFPSLPFQQLMPRTLTFQTATNQFLYCKRVEATGAPSFNAYLSLCTCTLGGSETELLTTPNTFLGISGTLSSEISALAYNYFDGGIYYADKFTTLYNGTANGTPTVTSVSIWRTDLSGSTPVRVLPIQPLPGGLGQPTVWTLQLDIHNQRVYWNVQHGNTPQLLGDNIYNGLFSARTNGSDKIHLYKVWELASTGNPVKAGDGLIRSDDYLL